MNEQKAIEKLKQEGFTQVYTHEDAPNAYNPNHTHESLTAHIIIEGEMTLTMNNETKTYKVGDRVDVPAKATHSAKMGPKGCRYIIGEK